MQGLIPQCNNKTSTVQVAVSFSCLLSYANLQLGLVFDHAATKSGFHILISFSASWECRYIFQNDRRFFLGRFITEFL